MNTGAPHVFPCRQLITPSPNSPPMINAAFFTEGMTTTHRAFSQIRSGMPLSGTPRSSDKTAVASFSRLTSSFVNVAHAVDATDTATRAATPVLSIFIEHLVPRSLYPDAHAGPGGI